MADGLLGPGGVLDPATPVGGLGLLGDVESPGPFRRGFGVGAAGAKGALTAAAALGAQAVGATDTERALLESAEVARESVAQDVRRVEDVDWRSPSAVAEHFKYLLGQAAPTLALMFAGGVLGRGAGALLGRAAPTAAKTLKTAGTYAGAVVPDVALEAGEIYPEALETGVESPALRALGGGTAAAALDFIPLLAAGRYITAARRGAGGFGAMARKAAIGAPVGVVLEGGQELGQAVIERAAAGLPLTDPNAVSDYINSFVGGAAPGTLFGAAIGATRGRAAPARPEPQPLPQPQPPAAEPIVSAPAEIPLSPEDAEAAAYAGLVTARDTAAERAAAIETQLVQAQEAQAAASARMAELKAEEALPLGERRTKAEIIVERRAIAKQVKDAKAGLEALGGELRSSRATVADLAPQIEAARQKIRGREILAATPTELHPEIKTREEPPVSDVIETRPVPDPVAVDRAVKGVHAIFREQGMPLTTTAESLATPPLGARDVALARVAERTAPRETIRGPSAAQMAAIEPHAMEVIEPMTRSLAGAKAKTPEGRAKVQAALTDAMRAVVQEAAKKGSVAEAQAHIVKAMPAALKGRGVSQDAEDIAKAVSAAVGQATTVYSRGAVDLTPGALVEVWQPGGVYRRAIVGRPRDGGKAGPGFEYSFYPVPARGEPGDPLPSFGGWAPARYFRMVQESNAALTQDEFDALPEAGRARVVDEYNAIMARKGLALTDHLRQLIGDDPNLMVTVFQAKPGEPIGSYTRVGKYKSLISLALNAKQELSVADHEGFHYAEDQLLDARERAVVRNALRPGQPLFETLMEKVRRYDIENQTKLADEVAATPAEAHAYAFEFWRRGELQTEGFINQVFEKIAAMLRAVARFITGQGFTTLEDIFTALDRGQFAARQRASEGVDVAPMLSVDDPARWYRSALTDQVALLPMKSGTAQAWQEQIKGLVAAGKVKQAEIDAVGLDEFLRLERPGKLARDEVLGFLRENGVQVEEVVLGENQPISAAMQDYLTASNLRIPQSPHTWGVLARSIERAAQRQQAAGASQEEINRQFELVNEAQRYEEGLGADGSVTGQPRYADYQLPGGTNYRELLLRLPGEKPFTLPAGWKVEPWAGGVSTFNVVDLNGDVLTRNVTAEEARAWVTDAAPGTRIVGAPSGLAFQVLDDEDIQRGVGGTVDEAIQDAGTSTRGLLRREPVKFTAPHFGELGKNLLAHVRLNSRVDAEGKKVLFLEELQSDWAQKGKKEGFKRGSVLDRLPAGYKVVEVSTLDTSIKQEGSGLWRVELPDGRLIGSASVQRHFAPGQALTELVREAERGIPTAPFVTKTDAWVSLVLKRMIRYAVDTGHDKIAWTTGAQQVQRYEQALRKRVDAIEWTKTKDGVQLVGYKGAPRPRSVPMDVRTAVVEVINRNDFLGFDTRQQALDAVFQDRADWRQRWEVSDADASIIGDYIDARLSAQPARTKVVDTNYKETELSDAIGKAMADRIRQDPAQSGTIEGEQITIDDTGMAGFYERIVPKVANEVLKKLGGGKTGEITVPLSEDWVGAQGQIFSAESTRIGLERGQLGKQPGFSITPAMVEKTLAGLPLFSRGALDQTPDGLGDVLNAMSSEARAAYSRAAVETDAEMARQMAAGEMQQAQWFQEFIRMKEDALKRGPDNLGKTALGALSTQVSGGLSRWYHKNIARPAFTAAFSAGFKNVYSTLNTYVRYRDNIFERGWMQRMAEWQDASVEDQKAAFTALNKRNVEKYGAASSEWAALTAALTEKQRRMAASANEMFAGFLRQEFVEDQAFWKRVLVTPGLYERKVAERREQVDAMIDQGYMPLRRYGDHTVHVYVDTVDKDGRPAKLSAGLEFFATQAQAIAYAESYRSELKRNPDLPLKVEVGTHYKAERDASISAQQFLDTARRSGVALTAMEQERLVIALTSADSLTRNRMLHREGMPGYSDDGMRIMAEFGLRMSGKLAYSKFGGAIEAAASGRTVESDVIGGVAQIAIDEHRTVDGKAEPLQDFKDRNLWVREGPMSGFHRNLADELVDYVLVPDHTGGWSRKLRGAAMAYFIGGSLSAGAVNVMSVPMLIVPELSIHTNYANAMSTTLSAWATTWRYQHILRDIERLKSTAPEDAIPGVDAALRGALVEAAQYTMDTELHQIMGVSQGQFLSQSQKVRRAMKVWMAPFRISEQANRITSFIAAYRVASTGEGVRQPDGSFKRLAGPELFRFAREMIGKTQNDYTEVNRPGAARNPVFALAMMFKSFPLFMTEAVVLMYKANPRSAVYMLLGLTAMTGVQGLPFAETLQDLIDTIAQRIFGSSFNTRRAMRNTIKQASEAIVGYDLSDIVLRGVINSVAGISASSRIGAGDFVPGTRLGTADAEQGRVLEEVLGAPWAMVKDAAQNAGAFAAGAAKMDWKQAADALRAGGPIAVRNAIKGVEQLSNGYASDSRGRRLVDINGVEGMLQLAGLSSAALAKAYEFETINRQTKAFYTQVSADMQNQLVRALKANDAAKVQEVLDLRAAWNERYPELPIMPNPAAVRRDLALSGMPMDRRSVLLWSRRTRGMNMFADVEQ